METNIISPVKPILVVDCGSSGTRIYHVGRLSSNNNLFCTKIGKTIPKIVDAILNTTNSTGQRAQQSFIQQVIQAAELTECEDVILAATAGLRLAKEKGTITDQAEKAFMNALPSSFILRELSGQREAELEYIVSTTLMNDCCPPPLHLTSAGIGMISMGGHSMQFVFQPGQAPKEEDEDVQDVQDVRGGISSGGTSSKSNTNNRNTATSKDIRFQSIPFAAHSAQDHVRGKPFSFPPLPPPVPKAIYVKKLEECTTIIDNHCSSLLKSNFGQMKGLVIGITGVATTIICCGFVSGDIITKQFFLTKCDQVIKTLSQLDEISYDPKQAALFPNVPPETTLGALTKTVVLRNVILNLLADDAHLLCGQAWMQKNASDSIQTEWVMGIFLERENGNKPGGLQRTISGGYWHENENDNVERNEPDTKRQKR